LLLVLVGVSALICLAGALTAYFWYDKTTQPDRSTPGTALEQFLDARFDGSTPERLKLLVCNSPDLAGFDNLVAQLQAQEIESNTDIQVHTAGSVITSTADDRAAIETDLVMTAVQQSVVQQDKQRWYFDMVWEGGWRVCAAHLVS
jgi:hypothetical protein